MLQSFIVRFVIYQNRDIFLLFSHNNLSDRPFDLVHIDTWDPFEVPTHDGYRLFSLLLMITLEP